MLKTLDFKALLTLKLKHYYFEIGKALKRILKSLKIILIYHIVNGYLHD